MEYIYRHPYFNSTEIKEVLDVSKPTALGIIKILEDLKIVSPVENKQRYVTYKCNKYVTILEEGTEL